MNRTLLLAHLARAERQVLQGEARLANQEALLAQLERYGHPTDAACELLATMRQAQAVHVGDRDRIRRELERLEARAIEALLAEVEDHARYLKRAN